MRVKIFYVLLACLCLTSVCHAEMSEEEFRKFYINFYREPTQAKLQPAFETFILNKYQNSNNPVWHNEYEKIGYARFFALLAPTNPELFRLGEQLFKHSRWEQKDTLLEVFKRAKDKQLTDNLHQWALAEEDDDRRVMIEQAALDNIIMEKHLHHSIRTFEQVEEQWACFFAFGNTRVVEASIDFVCNSIVGHCQSKKVDKSVGDDFFPRERRLKEHVLNTLLAQAALHPQVTSAILQYTQSLQYVEREELLDEIAYQLLDIQDAQQARKTIDQVLPIPNSNTSPKTFFLKGALAFLEEQEAEGFRMINVLEKDDKIYSAWLNSYHAMLKQFRLEKEWQQSVQPILGNQLALLCSQALASTKSLAVYEIWNLCEIPPKEYSYIYFAKQLKYFEAPDIRFQVLFKAKPEVAWVLKGEDIYLWTHTNAQWVRIENKAIYSQIKNSTGIEDIRNILASQYPSAILKITSPKSNYACLVYKHIENQNILDEDVSQLFPEATSCEIKGIQFWVELEKGTIIKMEIEIEVLKETVKIAEGKVLRIFHHHNATDLSWTKGLP